MQAPKIGSLFFLMIVGIYSIASGMQPCTAFVAADGRSFLINQAYLSADLIVIGKVTSGTKPILKIMRKINGAEKASEIELMTGHCQGTSCSGGFSVAQNVDLLFFLSRRPNGIYDSVTGNGNFSCPVVYEVNGDFVAFRDKKVSMGSLLKYLQSKASVVPLN